MKIPVFNPLKSDFSVTYDVNGTGAPVTFTVQAHKTAEFDEVVANHVKKHLATAVYDLRGGKTNNEDDMKAIMKELTI